MGEDASTGGAPVTERRPPEIRRDIDATRRAMGDTVEALSERADVKAQTQRKVAEVKQTIEAKRSELMGKARTATPDDASSAAGTVQQKAREHPLPIAMAGAFAAGLVVGRITNR